MFHLTPEDYSGDINSVTGALKLWFRELPDPLIPRRVSDQFISAASKQTLYFMIWRRRITTTHQPTVSTQMTIDVTNPTC